VGVDIVNATGLDLPESTFREQAAQIVRALDGWNADRNRSPLSMFTRGSFSQPSTPLQAIQAARQALKDDVVSTSLELIEGVSLETVSWESPDAAVAAAWNASAAEMDLDWFVRAALREMNTIGRISVATWWGTTQTRPDGTGPAGKRAKRAVSRVMPQRCVLLPAEKVLKLKSFWGTDKLVWLASDAVEHSAIAAAADPTIQRLIAGPYTPSEAEAAQITEYGGDPDYVWLLDSTAVWQYRLPDLGDDDCTTPLSRTLTTLELTARLLDSDRASLIAAANFVLIFKIGTDLAPAQQAEIDAYREGMTRIAKLPVIVGDHRLEVDILTPDTSAVLNSDKHATLNHRLAAATLGLPDEAMLPGRGQLDPEVPARLMVARIKTRRRMLQRALEKHLARPGARLNGDPLLESVPSLTFTPREVPIVGVTAALAAVLQARQRNELSRQTYLETLGYDQDVEAERRKHEAESGLDDTFQTHEPFDSPANGSGGPSKTPVNNGDPSRGGRPSGTKNSGTSKGDQS
jgi:hypothetical protein